MADSGFFDRYNGPLTRWVFRLLNFDPSPDPWSVEEDREVRSRQAVPLCTNCLFPQPPARKFCPHCDFPTGDWVAMAPYESIFVEGEALRQGVTGPPERRWWVQGFLFLYAGSQFSLFAPLYWFWMAARAAGRPIVPTRHRPELPAELFVESP